MAEPQPGNTSVEAGLPTPDPGPRTPDFRWDVAAVLLLVACLAGMFWKVIFTSAVFFHRDIFNYTFPSARFIHEICHRGYLPFWNPYLNYGQAVLANPNLLFFYPFTLLIVLLPADVAFTLHFLVHFALAGIGVYVLARSWRQSRQGAFFAAFVFMFSGPVLSLGDLYNESACAAWIPWALLITDRALASRRARYWILLIVIFSLQWLAGEPMTMLGTFGLCFAYALFKAVRSPESGVRRDNEPRNSKFETRYAGQTTASRNLRISNFVSSPSGRAFIRTLVIFFLVGRGNAGVVRSTVPARVCLTQRISTGTARPTLPRNFQLGRESAFFAADRRARLLRLRHRRCRADGCG